MATATQTKAVVVTLVMDEAEAYAVLEYLGARIKYSSLDIPPTISVYNALANLLKPLR